MKGLELARDYYEAYGKKLIDSQFSEYKSCFAIGLVGEGSECYGYDDVLSQDHDFGPGFCIWLPTEIYTKIGTQVTEAYNQLPQVFKGFNNDSNTIQGQDRKGVFEINAFYNKFTNCGSFPKDNLEWFRISERFLSVATNGSVFVDYLGDFSKDRNHLNAFYPEDVLRKKLAARVAIMAQSGQYNYPRVLKRGDYSAAYLSCSEFVKASLSLIYLLNGQYMPFYKWAFRGTDKLIFLKNEVLDLKSLVAIPDNEDNKIKKQRLIESICSQVSQELNKRNLSHCSEDFLERHCESIMRGILDQRLRCLHVMADFD